MDYAIIRVGNKQHRVRDGETLVVDRVHVDEGGTFSPDVLLGGDGVKVTVKVVGHERGPKIRIGKYRKRTGYKRHNGFRAATTRIEVSLGTAKAGAAKKTAAPKKEAAPVAEVAEADPAKKVEVTQEVDVAAEEKAAPEPEAKEPEAPAAPKGLPSGYAELTVVAIAEAAKKWHKPQLEAALAYEQEHAKRKGALAALESALAAKEEKS
jgi:large subunit ribosomal protein L21